jgi:GGDEF domain-containing protein
MQLAAVARPHQESAAILRSLELASQLRTAVMNGDDARIARLLSDLLRVKGLTKGERVRLQLGALSNLVHSLRSVALNDDLTGLCNRRGFMQTGTRLLDLAARDAQTVYLVYFRIEGVQRSTSDDVLMRQMGNFMRDLFPSYGVYEVLGRLSANEFAALTPDPGYAARAAIPPLPLRIAIARFDPAEPMAVEALLQNAARGVTMQEPISQIASLPRFAPQPGMTLC